jgi:hypothetical protein
MSHNDFKRFGGLVACLFATVIQDPLQAGEPPGREAVDVLATQGAAEYRDASGDWHALGKGTTLGQGSAIRTGPSSTIDFLIKANGTALRLPENSELHFEKLSAQHLGEMLITDTQLRLSKGTIVGSQRKLPRPSRFEIFTPEGKVSITGTEYVVRADGAVSVLSGVVSVIYNEPGRGGSIKLTVYPGQTFDPVTGMIVETTPEYLEDLIADVDTVRRNAEVYKLDNATLVVKPEKFVSPTTGQ